MTKIEFIDFSMDKVAKIQEKMLRKKIGLLKVAEMACKRQQEELQEQVDSLEKELEPYKK